jgi:hypothetical protein
MTMSDDDDKKITGEEEEPKGDGALSDGVLDAFEEVAPVDPALKDEEEEVLPDEDEEDLDIDLDEWN